MAEIIATEYNPSQYKRQLRGWLSYAFASEVFVIVSLTLFLPICLEQFARDNGYLLPDRTQPCSSVPTDTQVLSVVEDVRCVVKLGWAWIDTASFSLYVNSISVALQALTVISMGGIADHPPHRKLLLLCFAFFGASAAILFLLLPSSSPLWPVSALLGICSNVGFGASVVAMNAYLPTLAQDSEEVRGSLRELQRYTKSQSSHNVDQNPSEAESAEDPLLPPQTAEHDGDGEVVMSLHAKYHATLSAATSRISSLGIALGYAAGIILLLIALIPVTKLGGSTFSLRLAIGLSGIWWAIFSLPAAFWLPSSTPIVRDAEHEWSLQDADVQDSQVEAKWSIGREIINAWKRLGGMLRWQEIKKLRNTFQYLAAWFLLSDGFTTITSTAVLFAKTTLHMPASSLILIGVITPTSGILGSLVWPVIQRRFAWTNIRVLVTLVIMASVIPAYGCLGFLPVFQHGVRFGGLTTPGEMYALAVYFGSVYGAFQGYARAFYSELLPPGEEARWYGLFSITDKSSSFVGPLVVGLIADTTGNIRYAFFFLVVMVWLAVPILLSIDIERGRKDARQYTYRGSR